MVAYSTTSCPPDRWGTGYRNHVALTPYCVPEPNRLRAGVAKDQHRLVFADCKWQPRQSRQAGHDPGRLSINPDACPTLGAQRAHTAARLSSQRRSSCAQCRRSPASSSAPANTPCQADLEALRQGPCAALSLEPLAAFACRSQTREPGVAHANSLSTYGSARALLD